MVCIEEDRDRGAKSKRLDEDDVDGDERLTDEHPDCRGARD